MCCLLTEPFNLHFRTRAHNVHHTTHDMFCPLVTQSQSNLAKQNIVTFVPIPPQDSSSWGPRMSGIFHGNPLEPQRAMVD